MTYRCGHRLSHWQQDAVMQEYLTKWPEKSARISNYVTYKEKSARREVPRRMGASLNSLALSTKI